MIRIDYKDENLEIKGYITKPTYTRRTKEFQYFFVNGRYVKSKYLNDLLYEGYHRFGKLFLENHPAFVINLSVPPEMIDVNIHPTKLEIKFMTDISEKIINAIYNTLRTAENVLTADVSHGSKIVTQVYHEPGVQSTLPINITGKIKLAGSKPNKNDELTFLTSSDGWNKLLPLTLYGIVNKTYIIGEDKLGMVLIDQHAAEERVNFEKLMKQMKKKEVQKLLTPITIVASPDEYMTIEKNIEKYKNMGFLLEPYGNNTFILRSVPAMLKDTDSGDLRKLILDMARNINLPQERLYNRVATKACRMSIKGGDLISLEYAKKLLKELDNCNNPYMCPHGRPTMIRFTWGDLEKKFKRKV